MEHCPHQDRMKSALKRLEGLQKKTKIERAMVPKKNEAREPRSFLSCCGGEVSITLASGLQALPWAA